jgi:UDP-glucose 4-epimerase
MVFLCCPFVLQLYYNRAKYIENGVLCIFDEWVRMMILVLGGAGYIGSHTVKELLEKGHRVVVLDNLSTGHRSSLDTRVVFEKGDFGNPQDLDRVFSRYSVDAIIHLGCSNPGEYVSSDISQYYMDYVSRMLTLLRKMREYCITELVFSSTSEVYGYGDGVTEQAKVLTTVPYYRSQQMVEHFLEEFHHDYGLNYVILRYFNAAGAYGAGEIGEDHKPEAHLIPMVLKHLLHKAEESLALHDSYSGIREYLHVMDVAKAHVMCVERLLESASLNTVYNLGSGQAASVHEIISICCDITKAYGNISYSLQDARQTVSYEKIQRELGWKPTRSLEETIYSAWQWHSLNPDGYGAEEMVISPKLIQI